MNDTLEQLVDQHGLDAVLRALADVCSDKANHIRSNWQDETTAKRWQRAAETIDRCRGSIDV
jgi:hypothetical protein